MEKMLVYLLMYVCIIIYIRKSDKEIVCVYHCASNRHLQLQKGKKRRGPEHKVNWWMFINTCSKLVSMTRA